MRSDPTRRDTLKAAAAAGAALLLGDLDSRRSAADETRQTRTDRANWMADRFDALRDKPLREIVIPGAHDAGMYQGNPLGLTQGQSLYGQLSGGARYFDLRPSRGMKIEHGIAQGPPIQEVLDDVKRYMAEGRRELPLLKFSHYGDGFSDAAYRRLIGMIRETIGRWLLPRTWKGRLAEAPLHALIGRGGKVLVVADGDFPLRIPAPGIYVYRDWESADPGAGDLTVFDQYSNTMDCGRMSSDQLRKFTAFDGKCKNKPQVPCDLFLLSWTLTPPTGVSIFSQAANRELGAAMASVKRNGHGRVPNILYVDYFEDSRAADIAIGMNERL